MSGPATSVELADAVSALLYGVAGWLLIGLGSLGVVGTLLRSAGNAAPSSLVLSATVVLLSLVFIVFGVFVNPRFRRRLNRRGALTDFGKARSVDQGVLRARQERTETCVICGTKTDRGLVRRYREEIHVAGVLVSTRSEGRNHYCLDCAATEPTGAGPVETTDDGTSTGERNDRPATEKR